MTFISCPIVCCNLFLAVRTRDEYKRLRARVIRAWNRYLGQMTSGFELTKDRRSVRVSNGITSFPSKPPSSVCRLSIWKEQVHWTKVHQYNSCKDVLFGGRFTFKNFKELLVNFLPSTWLVIAHVPPSASFRVTFLRFSIKKSQTAHRLPWSSASLKGTCRWLWMATEFWVPENGALAED